MATIVIDFDAVMGFGDTYRRLSDSLDSFRSGYKFDAMSLDRQNRAFGISLRTDNPHWIGKNTTDAAADAVARMGRVADYLGECSVILFRHAPSAAIDDSLDWGGILADAWSDTWDIPFVSVGGEWLAGKANPIIGWFFGGVNILGDVRDLLTYEGVWETIADGLRVVADVTAITAGFIVVGGAFLGLGPVLVLAAHIAPFVGAIVLAAGAAAEVIDNWDTISQWFDDYVVDPVSGAAEVLLDAWDYTIDALTDGAYDLLRTLGASGGPAVGLSGDLWTVGSRIVPDPILAADVIETLKLLADGPGYIDSALDVGNWIGWGGNLPPEFWTSTPNFSADPVGIAIDVTQITLAVDEYGWGDARTWTEMVDSLGNVIGMWVPFGDLAWTAGMEIGDWLGDTAFFKTGEDILFQEISEGYDLSDPVSVAQMNQDLRNPLKLGWETAKAIWPF